MRSTSMRSSGLGGGGGEAAGGGGGDGAGDGAGAGGAGGAVLASSSSRTSSSFSKATPRQVTPRSSSSSLSSFMRMASGGLTEHTTDPTRAKPAAGGGTKVWRGRRILFAVVGERGPRGSSGRASS